MEFTIERSELLRACISTQGIVERRTTIPILGNVLLSRPATASSVAATDQEIGIRRQCTATVKKQGHAHDRRRASSTRWCARFPEGDVRIRSQDNNWIEVSAGKSRFRLVGLDPREFPAMPERAGRRGIGGARSAAAMLTRDDRVHASSPSLRTRRAST